MIIISYLDRRAGTAAAAVEKRGGTYDVVCTVKRDVRRELSMMVGLLSAYESALRVSCTVFALIRCRKLVKSP